MAGPLGSRGTGGRSGSAPSPRATQSPTVPRLCGHCTRFQDPCPGCSFRPPPANGGRQQLGPVVWGALLMRRTARPNCRMLALSLATPNNFLTVFTPPPCAITALCASDIRKRLGDFWGVPSEGPAFMPHKCVELLYRYIDVLNCTVRYQDFGVCKSTYLSRRVLVISGNSHGWIHVWDMTGIQKPQYRQDH